MGEKQIEDERRELVDELEAVVTRRMRDWKADHGQGADYRKIEIESLVRFTVNTFIAAYVEVHRRRPEFDHLAHVCCEYAHDPLVRECARQYGIKLVDPVLAAILATGLMGVPAHD
jgi:hypothetical protein